MMILWLLLDIVLTVNAAKLLAILVDVLFNYLGLQKINVYVEFNGVLIWLFLYC